MPTVTRTTTPKAPSTTTTPRGWAEGFDFNNASAVKKLQVAHSKAPGTGPLTVRRAYAFYKSWEDNDLGSVRLLKTNVSGKAGFALHTTTDGDTGFLELYSDKGALLASGTTGVNAQGRSTVRWDSKPGAVRERVAPKGSSPGVAAFYKAIGKAGRPSSPSGATVSARELKDAAKNLVGTELTTHSVDGTERSSLLRALTESKFSASTRGWGEQLADLYSSASSTTLTHFDVRPFGTARIASARVSSAKIDTMAALARRGFDQVPAQLAPVTRAEATTLLRAAGTSAADAKAALAALTDTKGQLYAGRFFELGTGVVPIARGLALFGVSSSGRDLKALQVPPKAEPNPGPDPRAILTGLLGVNREVEVTASRQTAARTQFDLVWRPPTGGRIAAKLNVPRDGSDPSVEGLVLPSVIGMTETGLADRISATTSAPQTGLSYAQSGADWLVAHRPAAGGPISLSLVKVALGGATASVAPANIGTGAAQLEVARNLSLGLARVQAEAMVTDPAIADAARLEVALRTRWAGFGEMQPVAPADSAVGFDTARDRAQFMLPRVWGDNAVFVTFPKAGAVRVEAFN